MGPVFILAGCVLLWYNEAWAVFTHRSLNEGLAAYVPLPDMSMVQAIDRYENRLVHHSNKITVQDPATDLSFGLSRNSVSLTRKVEIYQWAENHRTTRRKLQNGETEVQHHYDYSKKWTNGHIDSSRFEHPYDHENYGSMPYSSETFSANGVQLGNKFHLHQSLIRQLNRSSQVSAKEARTLPAGAALEGSYIYMAASPQTPPRNEYPLETKRMTMDGQERTLYVVKSTGESFSSEQAALEAANKVPKTPSRRPGSEPQIGDVRISFSETPCTTVSVLARLQSDFLSPWPSKQGPGYDIGILNEGFVTAEEMISHAQTTNNVMTWLKRGLGFLLIMIGYSMVTSIIRTAADITLNWIPLLGPMATSIISLGVSIANFILATCTALPVAAVAWLVYRPVLGITMLAMSGGLFYLASSAGQKMKNKGS